jgi:hypothetical protein
MPTKSSYPDVEIPTVDLWAFMFDRERDFDDAKGNLVFRRCFAVKYLMNRK